MTWEQKVLQKQKELERLQRKKRVLKCLCTSQESQYQNQNQKNKVYHFLIIAILFDFLHYNIYPLFAEGLQYYIYNCTQSIAFLLYIYVIYLFIPKERLLMHFVINSWLWFSIGDVIEIVYNSKEVDFLNMEHITLMISVLIFCYKFHKQLYLELKILGVGLKLAVWKSILFN